MTEERSRDRDSARHVAAALGDLFDSLAPHERAAAEDELRDARLDPARIAARMAGLAAALRRGDRDEPGAAGRVTALDDRLNLAAGSRAANAATPGVRGKLAGAARIAAALIIGIGIGWAVARVAQAPRGGVPGERLASQQADPEQTIAGGPPPSSGGDAVNGAPRRGFSRDTSPHEQSGSAPDAGQRAANSAPLADATPPDAGAATDSAPPDEMPTGEDSVADSGAEGAAPTSWILERRTWERGQELLPAPVLARVRSGAYWFEVQEVPDPVYRAHYSAAFWTASDANTDRFAVTPTTCSLHGADDREFPATISGLPFPTVAADQPAAACQVMWNAIAAQSIAGAQSGSLVVDLFDRGMPPDRSEVDVRFGAYMARAATGGRGRDDLLSAALLNATTPAKVDGTVILTRRYSDAARQDDTSTYSKLWRRVTRLLPSFRNTAHVGSMLNVDDVNCFDIKLEDFRWSVIGQRRALAPLIGSKPATARIVDDGRATTIAFPITAGEQGEDPSAPWHFVENLTTVPRPVWVIEGTAREVTDVSKVVLYIDAAMYRTYWKLVYGRDGALTKDVMCVDQWWRTRDRSVGLATTSAMSIVDEARDVVMLARYTSQQLSLTPPDPSAFTIEALIKSAR